MGELFAQMGVRSWKTTLSGAVAIISGVVTILQAYLNSQPVPWALAVSQIVAGVGLISAKDHNVSGQSKP